MRNLLCELRYVAALLPLHEDIHMLQEAPPICKREHLSIRMPCAETAITSDSAP